MAKQQVRSPLLTPFLIPPASVRALGWWVLPAIATLGVALLHLPFPFDGDQAFSLLGASAVARGETLYVDFWDIRQPGMIWFSVLAGELFGFDEFGLHSLELCWMVTTSAVIGLAAHRLVGMRELAFVAPALTVGVYYAQATPWELTQAESLVWLPLAVCLFVATTRNISVSTPGTASWVLFGVAAGLVAIFKLVLLVIPIALGATRIVYAFVTERCSFRRIVGKVVAPALSGFLVVIGLVLLYFWREDALDELLWTTFDAPILALAETPRAPYRRLLASAGWFAVPWVPAIPFLILGLRSRIGSSIARLDALLLGSWIASALASIAVQRLQWWPYQFELLIVPAGLLTLKGIDSAVHRFTDSSDRRRVAMLLLLPILLVAAIPCGPKLLAAGEALIGDPPFQQALQASIDPSYRGAHEIASAVSGPGRLAGTAFVFGDPRILLFSGRKQAIATRGWALYSLPQQRWDGYADSLQKAKPAYIYLADASQPMINEKAPDVMRLVAANYRPFAVIRNEGTWHERVAR